ncbi:outer membrane usher protein FimD/PapC [Novosphingobium kunmingense]|uniref:Outer membrane usher protein FimD/PapC n=1 Tax=Novosphingobium kunmingense TaxID=1211806 RepID=A0A2N0H515_9SPHN|nr:fimbria/pilus outer membrane usher protein [Novosphingobium kunmingense]PKB14028.1 outer membrane usher protein FimD/PapC [Novosphingobium kunmingense]
MRRSRPPAAERLLALAASFVAALGGTTAHAQTDPFALPTGLTAKSLPAQQGPGLSEIAIDGDVRARMVDLAWEQGALTILAADARAAGLPIEKEAIGRIALDSLRVAKWSFDSLRQRLEIQLMRKSDRGNLIDMSRAPRSDGDSVPLTALRVDYDLTSTVAQGRTTFGGFFDTTLVRGNVAATSAFQYTSRAQDDGSRFVRLDSQVQLLFPKAGLVATGGDFISAGGQSQRAVRLGGIQLASDYSLRPDLVTVPLPAFTGQVAVPTGVDVITGDQRYSLGELQPGEFTVRNVPSTAGRGEVSVIVRDALGREAIQNAKFYMSRSLLAPRLREFAINAGFVRRRYGVRSNDYGPLAANVYYRRGLSSRLTIEGTSEWTPGLINMGARGDLALGGIALLTVEGRASSEHATGKSGLLTHFALESIGRTLSARIAATIPTADYRDVATKLGDPLPPREFLGQISYNIRDAMQVQLTAGRQERRFDSRYPSFEPRVTYANANFRARVDRKIDFFSSFGLRQGTVRSYSAWAGLSFQFGGGRSAQASASAGTGAPTSASAGFYRHATEDHPIGYAFEGQAGAASRLSAGTTYRSRYGRLEGQVEQVNGGFGARVNARGTLLVTGGTVFARNQTGGSYALVRTGSVAGVTVMRENRDAGKTSRKGLLLVENITPQVPLTFDIDPEKLPINALARQTQRRVLVQRRAVGLVALDVIRFAPRAVRVTGPDGANLPVGTTLVARPSGEMLVVGFDGLVDFNAEGGDHAIERTLDNGAICVFDALSIAAVPAAGTPVLACRVEIRPAFVENAKARGPRVRSGRPASASRR